MAFKPHVTDGGFTLPAKRRVIFEYFEDVQIANTLLSVLVGILGLALLMESVVLIVIFKRPPYILAEESGYLMWRTTEVFQLRPDMVKSFLETTGSKMLTIQPGAYNLNSLAHQVYPHVIQALQQKVGQNESRIQRKVRQIWTFLEAKQYADPTPAYQSYRCFIVRAEKAFYEEQINDSGNPETRATSSIVHYLFYVEQIRPTLENPWGLKIWGFRELDSEQEAKKIWEASTSIGEGAK
ncbi:MAG: hypothetical protein V4507_01845 [Verrucomicrobiota bacterium]